MNSSAYEYCGLLWIKQADGPGQCFEDQSVRSPVNFKEELPTPREALIDAGKMSVKERKVKSPCGSLSPQNRSARGKTEKKKSQKG